MNGKHPAFEQRRGVVIGVVSLFTYIILTMASFKVPLQSAVKENGVGIVTFASGLLIFLSLEIRKTFQLFQSKKKI